MAVWAIDGVNTPASVARLVSDAALKGQAGVLRPTDYQVTEMTVPGKFVRVLPGAASIKNTYAGVDANQNYIVEDVEAVDVPLPQTGSSPAGGVDRVVIKTVQDPQYPGVQAPADGAYDFFDIVDVGAQLDDYPHPYEKLYEFHQPANEANFYETFITRDWRRVANPGSWPDMRTYAMTAGETDTLSNAQAYPAGQGFPGILESAWAEVDIPERATHVHALMTWGGVVTKAGDVSGYLWMQIGWSGHPDVTYTQGTNYRETEVGRKPIISADTVRIPPSMRGTKQKFYPRGNVLSESSADARLEVNGGSVMVLQLQFVEAADIS